MNEKNFKESIIEAIDIIGDDEIHKKFVEEFGELEETYRQIVFKEILRGLLYKHSPAPPQELSGQESEGTVVPTHTKKSLEEFYDEIQPKNHSETVITFAYYFYKYGENRIFNNKDIEDCYSKVLIAKPTNIADLVNLHRRKGRIMLAKGKKDGRMAFAITRKGIEYVENDLKENSR